MSTSINKMIRRGAVFAVAASMSAQLFAATLTVTNNADTGAGFVTPENYEVVAKLATEGLR